MVPDTLRGRVMSVYSMMYMGLGPVGALIAGFVAERIGAERTLTGGAVICLLAAAVFGGRLQSIRSGAAALIRAQQEGAEVVSPAR
jgi:MFS family permease